MPPGCGRSRRARHPGADRLGLGQARQAPEIDACSDIAGIAHFGQVTGKAETGDIGHGMHALYPRKLHADAVGLEHRLARSP